MKAAIKWLNRLEEVTLTMTLLGLAVVAFTQVCTRYLMGISFDWFEEGGRYVGVFVTFLGAGIGVRKGTHFTMELVADMLPKPVSRVLALLVGFLSGSCFVMVAYYGFVLVQRNYRFEVSSAAIGAPMWLVYLPIPALSVVIAIRFYITAIKKFRSSGHAAGEVVK
ncbi:MAG: TRAP transporter small permease [Deltaproteobacteria bacterium]|nr:MAG: TRAP transporter small permease [Deltaproteobacteria bacterium]